MFIRVDDIHPTLTVTIRGDESWLGPVQTSLQESDVFTDSKITGEIHFRKDSAGFVYGNGNVKYTPMLSCSRCATDIPWPLDASISATWRPPFESVMPRELSLSAEDLDTYFTVDGKINLQELVNDVLHFELPDQVIVQKDESSDCGICGVNLLEPLVYGNNEPLEKPSPFATLKNLKIT